MPLEDKITVLSLSHNNGPIALGAPLRRRR